MIMANSKHQWLSFILNEDKFEKCLKSASYGRSKRKWKRVGKNYQTTWAETPHFLTHISLWCITLACLSFACVLCESFSNDFGCTLWRASLCHLQPWSAICLILATSLAHSFGISVHHSTAYHWQTDGLVEWLDCTFKSSLHAHLSGCQGMKDSPWILFS